VSVSPRSPAGLLIAIGRSVRSAPPRQSTAHPAPQDDRVTPCHSAQNAEDLFFIQTCVMTQLWLGCMGMLDRRRKLCGLERVGPAAFDYSHRVRLTMFRGSRDDAEWTSDLLAGRPTFTVDVDGGSAFVEEVPGGTQGGSPIHVSWFHRS